MAYRALVPRDKYAAMKLEELVIEYNYLLSNQLDKQRMYFQQQLRLIEMENEKQIDPLQQKVNKEREKNAYMKKRER